MKIFLSSTILDLKDLRDALVTWLTEDGHEVIASEKGTVTIEPDKHSYDQCLKAAAECDCLVAVIDGRFGGEYPNKGSNRSITEEEIDTAIAQGKKTLIFVRQSNWDAMAILPVSPNNRRFKRCQEIIFHYAQIIGYYEFYNAWHQIHPND
jgi:Domain of unknown function (DUF4062)